MRSFWMASPTVSSSASCSPLSVPLLPFFTPSTHPTTFLTHSNSAYPHPYYSYYNPPMPSFLPRHLPHPSPALSTGLPARYLLPMNAILSSSVRPPVSPATHNWKEISHSTRNTEEQESNQVEDSIAECSKRSPEAAKCSHGKEVPKDSPGLASLETESPGARRGNGHLQDSTAAFAHMLGSPSPLPGAYSRKRKDSSVHSRESKGQGYSELTNNNQIVQPSPSSYTSTPAWNGYFSPSIESFSNNNFSSRLKVASDSNTHTPMYYKVPPHTMWHCQLTAAKAQ